MKRVLIVLLGVLALAALPIQAAAGGRSGHHGHRGHGHHRGHSYHPFSLTHFGWGHGGYPAYGYSHHYPYRPQTTVVVEERVVYVEKPQSAESAESWWYYCGSAGDYYPDVASCREDWVKVAPRSKSRQSPQ